MTPRARGPWGRLVTALVLAVLLAVATGAAQRFGGFRQRTVGIQPNVPYDGRFTFARIRYLFRSGWEYDYPTMERNLMSMMGEITALNPHLFGSNVHTLDDPELMKYPVAYLSEPGYWVPNDAEVEGLRQYLQKGGFLIVDDFRENEWYNFESQITRVLPGGTIERLELTHPVFHSFFEIQTLEMMYPGDPYLRADFLGIHDDSDPARRLMVVINYNNDIGDYMEWSLNNIWPVDITNEAYKFAINYIVYGLSH